MCRVLCTPAKKGMVCLATSSDADLFGRNIMKLDSEAYICSGLHSIQDEWKEVAEQLLHDIDAARVRKDRQLEFYTRMLFWAVTGCDMPPPEFYCPISLEIMEDPVVLIETAVTYDKKSLDTWLHVYGSSRCPVSGQQLERLGYVENKALRCLIDDWKRHHMSQVG